jgi:hypothetical protein
MLKRLAAEQYVFRAKDDKRGAPIKPSIAEIRKIVEMIGTAETPLINKTVK